MGAGCLLKMRSKMHNYTMNSQLRPPKRHKPRKEGEERHRSDQPVTGIHLDNHLDNHPKCSPKEFTRVECGPDSIQGIYTGAGCLLEM